MACAAITERPKSQFISHDNSVIKLTSRKQGGLEAEFYHLDEGSRAFTENSDNRIVWAPRNFKLHMVTAKCVAERRTGLHLPCILVSRAKKNKNFVNYFVFLSHEKKEFLAVGKFRTSYDLEMVDCVCLCDGPLACWRKGHDWYYTSLYGIDEWMDVQKAPSLIGIHTLLHLKMVENYVVAMGTRRTIQDDAANSKFWDNECVLVAFDPKGQRGQGDSDMHLESDLFIPHAYANIVTCVYVSGPIRLPVSSKSGGNHKMDEKGNNLIFVGTSQGQLLEFRDGKITKCCGLGFSDLGNISVATVTGGNDVIIVRSVNRGQACAVLMENFLIMKSWETVCDVFVDDFLQCGCDQILLLHREESLIGYTLTDLQTDISDDANLGDYATCNEGDSSSLSKAVIALESRLQVSLASLRDAETLYDTKFDVLRQSCKSLYSMASGKEGNGVQDKPCLVCLYDGCEQQETEPYQYAKSKVRCQMSYSVSQDEVETSRAWQYTVNGKWVIGVKVENKKNQSICNLCLSLVPITGVMSDNVVSTSTCKLPLITKFDHNCDFYSKRQGNPPPRKKHKNAPDKCHKATLQPGSQLDVIAVTTLPHFSDKGVCQCSLVLQWREKSGMKGVKQCESNLQKSLCIGMALLTAADVAFGKYDVVQFISDKKTQSSLHQLLAMGAAHCITDLTLSSKYTNLMVIPHILQSIMGFDQLPEDDWYISRNGALTGVIINLAGLETHGITVNVGTSDVKQLLMLIHVLYEKLPQDVRIDKTPNEMNKTIKMVLESIGNELHKTSNIYQTVLKKTQTMVESSIAGKSNWDRNMVEEVARKPLEIENERMAFEFEKDIYKMAPEKMVDREEIKGVIDEFVDLMLNTDKDVINLALL